jgi:hypothetical protein
VSLPVVLGALWCFFLLVLVELPVVSELPVVPGALPPVLPVVSPVEPVLLLCFFLVVVVPVVPVSSVVPPGGGDPVPGEPVVPVPVGAGWLPIGSAP